MQAAVTSNVRDLPLHHGMREQPSGRLPSERTKMEGSVWLECLPPPERGRCSRLVVVVVVVVFSKTNSLA